MILILLMSIAGASESKSYEPQRDVALGVGLFQVPGVSHELTRQVGRVNVHGLYAGGVGHRGWRAGLHVGAQSVPYGPKGEGRNSLGFRFEPRFGYRIAREKAVSADLMLGGAFDIGDGMHAGPVLSLAPRVSFGENRFTFVYVEGRLAPLAWGYTTLMACAEFCDQARVYNPGGTGVIVGVGRVLR